MLQWLSFCVSCCRMMTTVRMIVMRKMKRHLPLRRYVFVEFLFWSRRSCFWVLSPDFCGGLMDFPCGVLPFVYWFLFSLFCFQSQKPESKKRAQVTASAITPVSAKKAKIVTGTPQKTGTLSLSLSHPHTHTHTQRSITCFFSLYSLCLKFTSRICYSLPDV